MRILLFGNSTWCLYNFRRKLIRDLIAAGNEVVTLAPFDPTFDVDDYAGQLRALGAEHIVLPLRARGKNPVSELRSIFKLAKVLRQIQPDYVLSYTVKCNLYTGLLRFVAPFKQIANVPGLGEAFERKNWVHHLVCVLYRLAFRNVHTVFFQNLEDMNYCLEKGLVPAAACKRLPGSGVDLDTFRPSVSRTDGKKTFLMFGRLLPKKGYYQYLSTAGELRKKYPGEVSFEILGIEDKNRPESKELLKAILEADERGDVVYHRSTNDVLPYIHRASTVVLPSTYNEGVPRSLLEAMACGKPIITTDWRGCRETIEAQKNGFLVEPGDETSLCEAIEKVVKCSKQRLDQMGRWSRKIVEERFSEEAVVRSYFSELGQEFTPTTDEAIRAVG